MITGFGRKHKDTSMLRVPLASWLGGKSRLAKQIIERIPPHVTYAEPFAGAAWVLFNKPQSQVEILNDINKDIITLYRCLQNHLDEFLRHLQWSLASRDEFERLKSLPAEGLTDIQRAVRFFYLQQSAFGGHITDKMAFGMSRTHRPKLNLEKLEERLAAAHARLCRCYIECKGYAEFIAWADTPGTFFYVDPPYWNCEDFYGRGIFGKEDFPALAEGLACLQGKFLLSLNDTPEVREIFKAFSVEEVATVYTANHADNKKVAHELLISNF